MRTEKVPNKIKHEKHDHRNNVKTRKFKQKQNPGLKGTKLSRYQGLTKIRKEKDPRERGDQGISRRTPLRKNVQLPLDKENSADKIRNQHRN